MLAGALGDVAFAAAALALLRRDGVDLGLLRRAPQPTGCAAIMVGATGENLIAVASGANAAAVAADVPDDLLGRGTILICQREVRVEETADLIRRASARGATTLLNLAPAAPIDPDLFGAIDLLVANAGEAATLDDDPARFARRLRQALVVTRGAAGATAFVADESRI